MRKIFAVAALVMFAATAANADFEVTVTEPAYNVGSGGEFTITDVGAMDLPDIDSFSSFCVELGVGTGTGQNLLADISFTADDTGVDLNEETAWLYREFRDGFASTAFGGSFSIGGVTYSKDGTTAGQGADGVALQRAIWAHMGQIAPPSTGKAKDLYDAAIANAVSGEFYFVRILNLFEKNPDGSRGDTKQSQLTLVPVPGALLLGALGIGAIPWLKRRSA